MAIKQSSLSRRNRSRSGKSVLLWLSAFFCLTGAVFVATMAEAGESLPPESSLTTCEEASMPNLKGETVDEDRAALGVLCELHDQLIVISAPDNTLSFADRKQSLVDKISASFDLDFISRYVVGPDWEDVAPEIRDDFVAAFTDWSASIYTRRFNDADLIGYDIVEIVAAPSQTLLIKVELHIATTEEPVVLSYRLRRRNGAESQWAIVDVIALGGISELAARRSEFGTMVKREGLAFLISHLVKRAIEFEQDGDTSNS